MLIDSHCHLDFPDFATDGVAALISRAQAVGVGRFLTICTHIAKFDQVLAIAESSPLIDCSLGTHPHQAAEPEETDIPVSRIIELAKHPKVVALGETGLDYHYDFAPRAVQHRVFENHIAAAIDTGLPLIIHTREAEEDTIRILREAGQGKIRGVMHCFTGSQWLAEQALDIGFYISFSGIVTFKKSEELRAVAKTVPLDRLLVETDSPYLAPQAYRGKRNEPAYVIHTAETIADVKGVSAREIADVTTDNFFTLFNRAQRG
jgi:TatD DNase family protein